ncbi:MAG: 50S ribosomal protein L25 [Candidatus Omnitrophica bacterium]|nr:50S ribosomal protein L25 [Candidatus Omnitrophota bacterium]
MEQIKLDVQVRNKLGSQQMKDLRHTGVIPAVVYGGGAQPINVQIARNDFERIMRKHEGESVIFHVHVQESGKAVVDFPALMRDIQHNPVSDAVMHLDFQRISLDKEISIRVPIILKGEAVGLKKPGATLEQMMRELEVICLPKDIPHHIELDVTNLDIHTSIHVREVKLGAGVRTKADPELAIVAVVFATREAEPTAAEAGPAELEVIKEKPKEEKAEEGAAAAGAAAKPAAGAKAEGGAKK